MSFLQPKPTAENYWRGIILLGRNVASYKLALAKSLLEIAQQGKDFVTLEELALPYTRYLTEHLMMSQKQITSKQSKFLDVCRKFNTKETSQIDLIDTAVRIGFNNVIDAFHNVNNREVAMRFFVDERKSKGGIELTDELYRLQQSDQGANLPFEVESRWRLLETAWTLQLPPRLLTIRYDGELESLFVQTDDARLNVTSCRDALNGYQRGRCFYCRREIALDGSTLGIDVDHFFPIAAAHYPEMIALNLNGVWNLVLSCHLCNRGTAGKFMRVPVIRYLERLHARNEYFIESHHPLRETLMNQTGQTELERRGFLQDVYNGASTLLITDWEAPEEEAHVC